MYSFEERGAKIQLLLFPVEKSVYYLVKMCRFYLLRHQEALISLLM